MKGSLKYVPLDKATTPRSGRCIADHWWVHHPDKGLVFYVHRGRIAPQCNTDRRIIADSISRMYPEAEALFVPAVFVGETQ